MNTAPNWLDARMLRLQGPGRPWSIMLRLGLAEPVGAPALDAALAALVAGRPELNVRLDGDGATMVWRRRTEPVRCQVTPTERLLDDAPDPRYGPPIAVGIDDQERTRAEAGRTPFGSPRGSTTARSITGSDLPSRTVTLAVNHGFTDGLGALAIAEDLLTALDGAPLSARRSVRSDDLDVFVAGARPGLRGMLPPRRPVRPPTSTSRPTALALAHAPLTSVKKKAAARGVTVTELLLGAAHSVLGGQPWPGRRIVVSTPVDIRRRGELGTGSGNAVIAVSTITDRGDAYAEQVRAAAADLRSSAAGQAVRRRLRLYRTIARPGPPRRTRRRGSPIVLETAVLSNLGAVVAAGPWSAVRTLEFAPPAHRTMSLGVATLGAELTITVRARADPGLVSRIAGDLARLVGDRSP